MTSMYCIRSQKSHSNKVAHGKWKRSFRCYKIAINATHPLSMLYIYFAGNWTMDIRIN